MDRSAKLYCTWADRGMALHNSGGALLCCHSRTFLQDQSGQRIFWHTHSLQDAWDSPTRREIQDALTRGEQHPNCGACFSEENTGGVSRRQHHLNLVEITDDDRAKQSPILLDLKLANICNLSCPSCNRCVSSRWYRDWWEVFDKNNTRFQNYTQYLDSTYRTGKLSYSADNEEFWTLLHDWIPHVKYVDIYGAEPTMIPRLFDVLENSIHKGYAHSQVLHFNTNGTIWNQRYIDILTQFKSVYVDLSVDGLYDHYDYIRYGETWPVIQENIAKYMSWKKNYYHHHLNACITISIFNIFYLDQLVKYFDDIGLYWHFNMAHLPEWVNINCIPEGVKHQITDKLRSSYHDARYQQEISSVLTYMNETRSQNPVHHWNEFVRSTIELDARRKQNFAQTFPEFYSLIQDDFLRAQRLNIKSQSQ
jgi:MoaA/NifB/PqqE/SkfB family radical SAM enzyme